MVKGKRTVTGSREFTIPSTRKIALKGGVKRISDPALKRLVEFADDLLDKILFASFTIRDSSERKRVNDDDVRAAIKFVIKRRVY